MIYLIGGVPRAGKSTLAKMLVEKNGISFVSIDMVFNMLADTMPELNLVEPYAERHHKFFPFFKNLVKHVQNSVKDYAIEGDIFSSLQVHELKKEYEIHACFLGFSKITLQDIKDHVGENDWLNDLSDVDLQNLPAWIVETSRGLKEECEKYSLSYFDMAEGSYKRNLDRAYTCLLYS